jgi:hypothetical protein
MSPSWLGCALLLLGLGVVASTACGPSYQALYEGDARFEHCYALEETSASMGQKGECWHNWIGHYTYGQTRDRVEYAAARDRALNLAHQAPTDEALMAAAPGEGRSGSIAAPAPTSAFAPPPKTLAEDDDAGTADAALPGYVDAGTGKASVFEAPTVAPPGQACSTKCDAAWTGCRDRCDAGARCIDACAATYKKCMRGCFTY